MKKMFLCFICALLLPQASRLPQNRNIDFDCPAIAPEVLGDGSMPLCTPDEPCGPHLSIADGSLPVCAPNEPCFPHVVNKHAPDGSLAI